MEERGNGEKRERERIEEEGREMGENEVGVKRREKREKEGREEG